MPIPAIAWGFLAAGAVGGIVVGAVARQPEVNKLHSQVRSLHEETKRLNRLVDEQNRQINVVKTKYDVMNGMNRIKNAKDAGKLKGAVMYSYLLKEYIDVKYRIYNDPEDLTPEEIQFDTCFSKELSGLVPPEDRAAMKYYLRMYIREKYADQIDNLEECDLSKPLRALNELDEKDATEVPDVKIPNVEIDAAQEKEMREIAQRGQEMFADEYEGYDAMMDMKETFEDFKDTALRIVDAGQTITESGQSADDAIDRLRQAKEQMKNIWKK